jgi:hypothetical protein
MSWVTAPNSSTCKNTSLRTKSRHLLLQFHFSLLMLQEPKSFSRLYKVFDSEHIFLRRLMILSGLLQKLPFICNVWEFAWRIRFPAKPEEIVSSQHVNVLEFWYHSWTTIMWEASWVLVPSVSHSHYKTLCIFLPPEIDGDNWVCSLTFYV